MAKTIKDFPGIGSWLKTDSGHRFLVTFIRRNLRRLLSTQAGASFVEWFTSQVEKEHRPVVIEVNGDGLIRVYGDRVSVKVVHRLKSNSAQAEVLTEELVSSELRGSHAAVYLDERKLVAVENTKCNTVLEHVRRQEEIALFRSIRDCLRGEV